MAHHQQLSVPRRRRPRQQDHPANEADEDKVNQSYRHKPAILPAGRSARQAYSQVSHLCPVLEPHTIRLTDSVWRLRAASTSDGLQGYHRAMAPRLADDELTAFLDDFNARQMPSAAETGAAALRAAAAERAAARASGPELSAVRDLQVPPDGRAARLYRPTAQATALVLYLHGGGFVFGDLETHDRACRRLADRSGVPVLALDYRRAPEHPWPAAVDDAVAALRWIASQPPALQIAPAAVAIAGDSAGGTAVSGSRAAMLTDPRVSPLFAPDLTGLPTAFVITGEHDPLRDQGEAYAGRLREAAFPRPFAASRAWSTTSCSGTRSRRHVPPPPIASRPTSLHR